jgi:hypothetical protein
LGETIPHNTDHLAIITLCHWLVLKRSLVYYRILSFWLIFFRFIIEFEKWIWN